MDKPKIRITRVDLDTYQLSIPTIPSGVPLMFIRMPEKQLNYYFTTQAITLIKELQIGQELTQVELKIDSGCLLGNQQ